MALCAHPSEAHDRVSDKKHAELEAFQRELVLLERLVATEQRAA